MKIYKYKNQEEYINAQKEGVYNHPVVPDAINYEWVQHHEIEFIKNNIIDPYFQKIGIVPQFGICHGAKLGKENKWFEEATQIDFIGTDIVVETNEKMKLVQWDFHKTKKDWENKFDIIYSNALDHSYDPQFALKQWKSCLSSKGICILEWSEAHSEEYVTHIDPFGASIEEYEKLINSIDGKILSKLPYESNMSKVFITFTH